LAISAGARAASRFGPAQIPPSERLDASARRVVQQFLNYGPLPLPSLTPREACEQAAIMNAAQEVASKRGRPTVEPVGSIRHIRIPGSGGPLLARVYTPRDAGPFPCSSTSTAAAG